MTDKDQHHHNPVIRDKRRIDPETGAVRQPEESASGPASPADATARPGDDTNASGGQGNEKNATDGHADDAADHAYEGPDIETSAGGGSNGVHSDGAGSAGEESSAAESVGNESDRAEAGSPDSLSDVDLDALSGQISPEQLAADRLADLQRITAEYANYRKRTEANREAESERAIGDVAKTLLPVLDDIDRAEKHGDLKDGGSFATIAAKLRVSAERIGLKPFIPTGEPFDPAVHEAIFQQPSLDIEAPTVADVVETGYYLGSTLLRAAKVVVAVPNG